jgi:nucleotide-binding universal stress UspA family protein
MRFLVCIGGVEPSVETIRFGAKIAKAFRADVSVLYVQPKIPLAVRTEVRLAREKLSEWEIELPGVKVLRGALEILRGGGFVKTDTTGEIDERHALKPGIRGAYELHVYGPEGEDIRLRLREGDIISEINREIESDRHDLVIFGASRERRILQNLIQFINCSMLVLKNPKDVKYEFLICTDSSPASRKAELFGAKLARFLDSPVRLLSVAKFKSREHMAIEGAERASKFLAKAGVEHSIVVRVGDVLDEIASLAQENSVVVMGASQMPELKKLFLGSKPSKIVELVPGPVLIVK